MNENTIHFSEDGEAPLEDSFQNLIHIKRIRAINSAFSLAEHFKAELRQIELEDLEGDKEVLKKVVSLIQQMRPNTLVLQNDNQFLVIETEIRIGSYLFIRGGKLIASGEWEDMQKAALLRIQREFPGKFDSMTFKEIDTTFLTNFSIMHYNHGFMFRIISSK